MMLFNINTTIVEVSYHICQHYNRNRRNFTLYGFFYKIVEYCVA